MFHEERLRSVRWWRQVSGGQPDPNRALPYITNELIQLMEAMPGCMVQVVGGVCSVITTQWFDSRLDHVTTDPEVIERKWKIGAGIYKLLSASGKRYETEVDEETPSYLARSETEAGVVTRPAAPGPAAVSAPRNPQLASPSERKEKRKSSLFLRLLLLVLLGIPLTGVGGLLIGDLLTDWQNGENAAEWPSTTGTIMQVTVQSNNNPERPRYKPYVEYTYEVDGAAFTGHKIRFGRFKHATSEEYFERMLAGWRKGTEAEVLYKPNAPSVCALQPGHANELFSLNSLLLPAVVMTLFGLVCCWISVRR